MYHFAYLNTTMKTDSGALFWDPLFTSHHYLLSKTQEMHVLWNCLAVIFICKYAKI